MQRGSKVISEDEMGVSTQREHKDEEEQMQIQKQRGSEGIFEDELGDFTQRVQVDEEEQLQIRLQRRLKGYLTMR
ncbi:hypothetical protein SLA2020_171330 [Shorea laevis]